MNKLIYEVVDRNDVVRSLRVLPRVTKTVMHGSGFDMTLSGKNVSFICQNNDVPESEFNSIDSVSNAIWFGVINCVAILGELNDNLLVLSIGDDVAFDESMLDLINIHILEKR